MKSKQKKVILVTGAAGYIGSLLIPELLLKNYSVIAFDNFYFGKKSLQGLAGKIKIVKGDIRNFPVEILKGVDTIIHLAGLSNDPTAEYNPTANFEINTKATVGLAKKAKNAGVKKFIFASSCSIYDLGIENENGLKNETSFVNPTAPYSLSKFRAEKKLLKLATNTFCVVILRKGTVYGFSPRLRYDLVVNTMVKNALKNQDIKIFCRGLQWRPLVYIKDVVKAYILAIEAEPKRVNKQVINITGDNYLIKDLAVVIQKTLKKEFNIATKITFEENSRKDRSYRVTNKKAKDILAFSPETKIDHAIVELVENIRKYKMNDFENPVYYNILWMTPIFEKETLKR